MRYSLSLALLGVAAVTVVAHPHTPGRHGVERRAVDLDAFRLQPTAEYVPKEEVPDQSSLAFISNDNYVDVATDLVKSVAPGIEFRVVGDHYVGTNGVAHVNFKQTAHGIDIDNADFNVNVSMTRKKREKKERYWTIKILMADLYFSFRFVMARSSATATASSPERFPRRAP